MAGFWLSLITTRLLVLVRKWRLGRMGYGRLLRVMGTAMRTMGWCFLSMGL